MKTTSYFFTCFILLSIFISCKQPISTDPDPQLHGDSIKARKTITLGTFSISPETDSCACFFAVDSSAYTKQDYIFAYDLSTTAYMKVNETLIKFIQTEYAVIGDGSLTTFTGGDFKLYLELKDVRETGKESTLQWGSIRIMDKNENATLTPFYGECACKKPPLQRH